MQVTDIGRSTQSLAAHANDGSSQSYLSYQNSLASYRVLEGNGSKSCFEKVWDWITSLFRTIFCCKKEEGKTESSETSQEGLKYEMSEKGFKNPFQFVKMVFEKKGMEWAEQFATSTEEGTLEVSIFAGKEEINGFYVSLETKKEQYETGVRQMIDFIERNPQSFEGRSLTDIRVECKFVNAVDQSITTEDIQFVSTNGIYAIRIGTGYKRADSEDYSHLEL